MKAFHSRVRALLPLLLASSALGQTLPYLLESDGTGPPNKLYWQTEPGVRYDLWKSDNLSSWQRVTGYPAVAEGLAMEHAFTPSPGGKGFFKMISIDEQPPVVVAQFPAVDGFAVGRFADLNIVLADATGIDPASIRLTVGGTGPLVPGAPGLTVVGNTVTYDSGDAALGAWGATVTATLVAADTLGHSLTHTWSFRLEPEPQTAANVFVFGSPTAQRAGQRVTGPAAALGPYFVRAMAGGQTVDSNTATLTVQTVTPENLDTDADGIPNIHETNTGTWISAQNRGTNPNKWDTDGDGLSDGVETNTRVYVSRSNTGTNPLAPDTDSDGVDDKREIDLGTDPNVPPLPPITGEFALIPAGWFEMGDSFGEGWEGESPGA